MSTALESTWFKTNIKRSPETLLWEITDACNLRCLHCEDSAGRKSAAELTEQEAQVLCDSIVAMGWRRVSITGGEPLLRKDWADICQRLTAGGCAVALITNGDLLNPQSLAQAKESGVDTISVSLDGLEETHNRIRPRGARGQARSAFRSAIEALRQAREAGFKTVVITHVNAWNYPELVAMHRYLTDEKVPAWQIQLGVPLGRMREVQDRYLLPVDQLPELEAQCATFFFKRRESGEGPRICVMHTIGYYGKYETTIRRGFQDEEKYFIGCVGGWKTLAITSDGLVKPCGILPREFAVGDVRKNSLAEIWNDADRFQYQSCWDEQKLEGQCRNCQYRCICRAGCTAMAYALTGSIYHNPYCIYGQGLKRHGARP